MYGGEGVFLAFVRKECVLENIGKATEKVKSGDLSYLQGSLAINKCKVSAEKLTLDGQRVL